jgi:ribosome-associated translation inhibitor RaiA
VAGILRDRHDTQERWNMQVRLKANDPQVVPLSQWVHDRVSFVLRRQAWLISQAVVRLTDVNGPRGGVDKRCVVEVVSDKSRRVVVTASASDWRAALDLALDRAVALLNRLRQRGLSRRRETGGPLQRTAARRTPRAIQPT